jgi:hypothetical protein
MKIISTKVHGVMDYLMGIILIGAPWLFNFASGGAETWVPVIIGIGTILYSLMTYYELGVAKILTMRAHLGLDIGGGLFLALSPWLFGFSDFVYVPHLILGLIEIVTAVMTDPVPGRVGDRTRSSSEQHSHAH